MHLNYMETITFSEHAVVQAQSRGIPRDVLELAAVHGKRSRAPGADGFRCTLTKKKIHNLRHQGIIRSPSLVEKSQGVTVVMVNTDCGWLVTTAYHKRKKHQEQRSYNGVKFRRKSKGIRPEIESANFDYKSLVLSQSFDEV